MMDTSQISIQNSKTAELEDWGSAIDMSEEDLKQNSGLIG